MTAYVPPGWPTGVQPPGSQDFERTAVTWLFEVVPSDYLLHGVLRRHPIALSTLARRTHELPSQRTYVAVCRTGSRSRAGPSPPNSSGCWTRSHSCSSACP